MDKIYEEVTENVNSSSEEQNASSTNISSEEQIPNLESNVTPIEDRDL